MKIGRLFLFILACGISYSVPSAGEEAAPYLSVLIQQAHAQHVSEDREWLRLLHYERDLFRRLHSGIDAPEFFLSPQGRSNPSAELDATLTAFFEPVIGGTDTQHPQCRYPARYAWLKDQLHFDSRLPEQPCPRFEKWRAQMDPDSITMVFASYYLNNPASMYGHTFLRLNKKGRSEKDRLLDYVVNFAAVTNSNNGVMFAVRGLAGGYSGRFSTLPYYMKVQEYNNLESRDLWEYTLAFKPAELDLLVRHLWEMGQASMDYYFLNKNCSYQLLPLLEVARPSLHLTDPFWFKTVPADTLRRVIQQPEMLAGVQVRRSHVSRMLASRQTLSKEEIYAAERLASSADAGALRVLDAFPPERKAKVLDSAYDLFRYRVGFAREQPIKNLEQERSLLLARNQVAAASPPPPLPVGEGRSPQQKNPLPPGEGGPRNVVGEASPDHGHPTGRVGASFGWTKHTRFEELSLRPALHDQNDNALGYIPGSQLQMFHLRLRHDNERDKTWVQDFTLIDILSLSPWDSWVRKPSWGVHTGLEVADDHDRAPERNLYYGLRGGSGLAYETRVWRREVFYTLAAGDAGVGGVFEDTYRLGGGVQSGVAVEAASWWRIHFDAYYLRYPLGERGEVVKLRLTQAIPVGPRVQVRCALERQNAYKEILLSVLLYL